MGQRISGNYFTEPTEQGGEWELVCGTVENALPTGEFVVIDDAVCAILHVEGEIASYDIAVQGRYVERPDTCVHCGAEIDWTQRYSASRDTIYSIGECECGTCGGDEPYAWRYTEGTVEYDEDGCFS